MTVLKHFLPNLYSGSVLLDRSSLSYGGLLRQLCSRPKGVIYAVEPAKIDVVEGKTYAWCACGRSEKQPFCDGSHRFDEATGDRLPTPLLLKSIKYKATQSKTVFFCNCKQTDKTPFCDGTHKSLGSDSD